MKNLEWDEDHETWEAFKIYEDFRWLFNKLEVALRQNLHAGPAGTAPIKSGYYISRPTYNTYGMGIGAKKFYYNLSTDYTDFINHAVVPPGHFWCEWIEGPQLSIDYEMTERNFWRTRSAWVGKHIDENESLVKFESWERIDNSLAPHPYLTSLKFPWWGVQAEASARDLVKGFNVEMRGGKIIEVHLRFGNDPFDDLPVGTRITPVWNDEEPLEGVEFMPNLHEDMTKYSASGQLSDVRKGFIVTRPNE